MRIIDTTTKTTIGTVTTNHSMTLEQACEAASVDLSEHAIEDLRLSMYSEAEEIVIAKECARESVKAGLVGEEIPTNADGEPMVEPVDDSWILDGDADWLRDKFGHVTDAMIRAYAREWNARVEEASDK